LVRVTSERSYVFRPSGNINTRIRVVYSAEKSHCTDPVAGDVLSQIGYYETKTGDTDKLSYVHKNLRNPEKKRTNICAKRAYSPDFVAWNLSL
jgi:hypothetical protein